MSEDTPHSNSGSDLKAGNSIHRAINTSQDGDSDLPNSESDPLLARENSKDENSTELSTARAYSTIGTLSLLTLVGSMSTGVLNISIPRIQQDLQLAEGFVLWPASIYSLVCGCFLLLSGSIADFVGARIVNFTGTFVLGISLVAAGICRTGPQIIAARGLQGLGVSMCFPSAVSILSHTFPTGRMRAIAFALFGVGQPLGFSLGLVLGGVFERLSGGWRSGYYLSGGIVLFLTVVNIVLLPKSGIPTKPLTLWNLWKDIDWLGVLISSVCLGILSYILAMITDNAARLKSPVNVVLLAISIALMPTFVIWMHYQEKGGRPALIPNHIWKNLEFGSICIMVVIGWGVIESMDLFFSLFYQNVQHLSALEASARFLPSAIISLVVSSFVGQLVHRFHNGRLAALFSFLSIGSPLLMALIDPSWSYWYAAFWASALGPLGDCVIFTVANLITTRVFPEDTQALAGAVFNTVAQFGASMGIAAMALVNSVAKRRQTHPPKDEAEFLMIGYRSVFWACTILMCITCVVGIIGLRRLGKNQS